jgi:hypothetical protein
MGKSRPLSPVEVYIVWRCLAIIYGNQMRWMALALVKDSGLGLGSSLSYRDKLSALYLTELFKQAEQA